MVIIQRWSVQARDRLVLCKRGELWGLSESHHWWRLIRKKHVRCQLLAFRYSARINFTTIELIIHFVLYNGENQRSERHLTFFKRTDMLSCQPVRSTDTTDLQWPRLKTTMRIWTPDCRYINLRYNSFSNRWHLRRNISNCVTVYGSHRMRHNSDCLQSRFFVVCCVCVDLCK